MPGKIRINFLSVTTLAFLIGLSSILSGVSSAGNVTNALISLAIMVITLITVLESNSINIFLIVIVLISSLVAIVNKQITLLSPAVIACLFFMTEASDTSSVRFANKVYFYTGLFLFAMVVFMALVFGVHNYQFTIWRNITTVPRLSIGFEHPNVALVRWLGLMMSFVLIRTRKHKILAILIFVLVLLPLYQLTKSRSSTYLVLFVLAVKLIETILQRTHVHIRLRSFVLALVPWIFLVMSILTLYIPWIQQRFDALLSGRISIYRMYFNQFGIHVFGTQNSSITMIDNSYIQMLITKGTLFTILLMFVFTMVILSRKYLSLTLAAIIFAFFFLGMSETILQHLELILPVIYGLRMERPEPEYEGLTTT
ncbi:hypothetical protein [Lacticaseibacillus hegangensis]|uniref:Polymerase n=1 Tax=Lacticaseibacillus hegangensis TaxID=2486010 RepID=A0ABW4CYS9_9LACO|nr:hypothetical protein [Lacticaseibacillus hegangensis]